MKKYIIEHNGNNYHFFWGGPFSNWYSSRFTYNGVEYNCGEQYMMHQKALFFNDVETAQKIMKESIPFQQKKLGRSIRNYDDTKWNEVRYEIVKKGLKEKYTQNEYLKKCLLNYKDCIIVEASEEDRIWGIGYNENNAIANIDNWGQNLLGKVLMEIRDEIT